jgi:capsular exopolysaccharide synthesis family protein
MASTVADTKVLEEAKVENAVLVTRKKEQNYTIALIIGFLFPLIVILFLDFITVKLTDVNQVTSRVAAPVLGKLGHGRQNGQIPVLSNPHGVLAESFRTLHAKLNYLSPDLEKKVIGFTSASSGEGKTFCTVNFAAILASMKRRTVVVALDLRKPKIHEIFKHDSNFGISTYLIGKDHKEKIITKTNNEYLDVISSGPIPPNPMELLEHDKLQELISELRNNYDYIIIDSPPIGLVADSFIINRFVDVNLFIVRLNFSSKKVINLIKDLTIEKSLRNINVVINDIRQSNSYGRNYYSYYGAPKQKYKRNNFLVK